MMIKVQTNNHRLQKIVDKVNSMPEVIEFLEASNVNLVRRLRYNDHGITHAKIVVSHALRIHALLVKHGIKMDVVDHGVSSDLSEVVLFLAAIFHDSGNPIHRAHHERIGLFWAKAMMEKILGEIKVKEKIAILADSLHACVSHECKDELIPITTEAGIISIADALDMEEGRARIPFRLGKIDIHSLSALAVKKVKIEVGKNVPINVFIEMTDTAGVFQVSNLLKHRLDYSGLKDYFHIKVNLIKDNGQREILELGL